MRRKRQYACRRLPFRGHAEGRKRLDGVDYAEILIQIEKIERELQSRLGNSTEWRQPEPLAGFQLEPFDAALELFRRGVGDGDLKAEKAFASLVISAAVP